MEDFTIYSIGLIYASVCSSLPADEVAARMRMEPTGVHHWVPSTDATFSDGTSPNPCPCEQYPETHKHYLFSC
jgi:hypothetical protein